MIYRRAPARGRGEGLLTAAYREELLNAEAFEIRFTMERWEKEEEGNPSPLLFATAITGLRHSVLAAKSRHSSSLQASHRLPSPSTSVASSHSRPPCCCRRNDGVLHICYFHIVASLHSPPSLFFYSYYF
ncbi:uncharacterized protein LOC130957576 [Arachis stenosperma]|uniref:uncharacterized protein LOC130957576 n=1 Tax=Arachis stenosperma TaxID=217475 RepID=UPI0025AD3B43|nr:uncharacterized protein LOC130957576 [Arachis stenosperma]